MKIGYLDFWTDGSLEKWFTKKKPVLFWARLGNVPIIDGEVQGDIDMSNLIDIGGRHA